MTRQLPNTSLGTPSYSLAKTLVNTKLDKLVDEVMTEYGLTSLEIADILIDSTQTYLKHAVRSQQQRNPARKGALGTPRQEQQQ